MNHQTIRIQGRGRHLKDATRRNAVGIKVSLHAVIVASFLLSMSIGVQALKITHSLFLMGAIVSFGLAGIYVLVPSVRANRRLLGGSWVLLWQRVGLALVILSAVKTGQFAAIAQSLLLAGIMIILTMKVPTLSQGAILSGGLLFAVAESGFLMATRSEWNPNSFCNHIMFAALFGATSIAIVRSALVRRIGILWICAAVIVGFTIGSRTATLSILIVTAAFWMIRMGKISRVAIRFIVLVGFIVTMFGSIQINEFLTEMAIENLDDNNPVSLFLVKDKSIRKLREDLFDRRELWEAAVRTMIKNPLLGIGYEMPLPGFEKFRAHNSYLEIGYQCGVVTMVIWGLIYFHMVDYAVAMIARQPKDPIVFLAFTSSAYLVIAGLMESSGILSLGTPGNWIAIICYLHLRTTPPVV
jgi:O-antigen ligase